MVKIDGKNCSELGKYFLSLTALNKNKLLCIDKMNHTKLKKELITDKFKRIIKHLLNKEYEIVEDKLLKLSDNEQKYFNDLLKICYIENIFEIRDNFIDTNLEHLIEKFNVIKDEIMVGNYSDELVKEFDEILNLVNDKGLLNKTDFNKLKKLIKT